MLGSYTTIETLLAFAVLLVACYELGALVRARREGLTGNRSRLVTHCLIVALMVIYVILAWIDSPIEGEGPIESFEGPTVPWRYLFLGGVMALVAAFEVLSMMRARVAGLTENVSRLIAYLVMLVVLLAMLGLAVRKWEHYLGRLDQTISLGTETSASE